MSLQVGQQLGSYEITSLIGKGGMGEVYRANDSKLGRAVAIKTLPAELARDPERTARFVREAQVLASLNYPNIGAIYDLQEADGQRYLVLELVEGETLSERIARGPIAIEEAVAFANEITAALEAAHAKGIVHRDLKPANIKITPEGTVKVLDFGLAKMMQADTDSSSERLSDSPTLATGRTVEGVILGTAAYMSPEQLKGKSVDRQTDVWAFGCVLYEMMTARPAFSGESIQDIMAAILKSEPDWTALPASAVHLKPLLARCLERSKTQRLRDIGDVRLLLKDAANVPAVPIPSTAPNRRARLAWIVAAVAIVLALTSVGLLLRPRPGPQLKIVRFTIRPPDPASFGPRQTPQAPFPAISPDGQHIVFVAQNDGERPALWLQSFDSLEAKELRGTTMQTGTLFIPFWSFDSRFVCYFADDRLKKIDVLGGAPQTITDAPQGLGATWGPDGTILFGRLRGGIMRVDSNGGTATAVTVPDADLKESSHTYPQFLPDGRHFIYIAGPGSWTLYVAALDSKERKKLFNVESKVVYVPGYLLFIRERTLMAQAFDAETLELKGAPVPIADNVASNPALAAAVFSASMNGTLVYRTGTRYGDDSKIVWYDRSGKELQTVPTDPGVYLGIDLSPDEEQLAVYKYEYPRSAGDVWLVNLLRRNMSRFTSARRYGDAIWSHDGRYVTYGAQRPLAIYRRAANGAGPEEMLIEGGNESVAEVPRDYSRDGRFLLYEEGNKGGDLWVLRMDDRKREPYLATEFSERNAQFSPDGHWVAYSSSESGRLLEIFIRPFPNASAGKVQVSTSGDFPRWRNDGKELFFIAPDRKLMAVSIEGQGETLKTGDPRPLFDTNVITTSSNNFPYDVSRDGQRFVIVTRSGTADAEPTSLTVVLNWTELGAGFIP